MDIGVINKHVHTGRNGRLDGYHWQGLRSRTPVRAILLMHWIQSHGGNILILPFG